MLTLSRPDLRRVLAAAAAAVFVIAGAFIAFAMPDRADAEANAATVAQQVPTGELTEVTDFGENPSNIQMYIYVPENVAPNPAIVVGVHWCTGSGPDFFNGTEYRYLADELGFIVVYPSVTRESKCWDVASPEALTRDGGSDPVGIKSMVDWTVENYDADTERIFATGASSGGMMTNVLLANYPDVFEAGAAFAGVPYTCFATDNGSEWNNDCSSGNIDRTPEEWGDAVRANNPDYTGPWPRMQTWHGTQDTVLAYPNFNEQIEQWTNVHGFTQTPENTDYPQEGWTRTFYGDAEEYGVVEAISVETDHNVLTAGMADYVMEFFGLTGAE
ncbi:extracellular catalytic domain type 1 short-chain-length polyhydroxyalkanoate depolymerase [Glycomyces buryatensis]|uniref:PHB depolymerase family esterase n=1 Tax=Glycomyces buryatensis TaxID=2570927 RepID=A0A4S8PVR5_9ACTN|nr:PHB depolymerase family esterase [Glycomyces buryatensis]THV33902.1 PHB depolymerase family esterase [Glycomyces buryatensis]